MSSPAVALPRPSMADILVRACEDVTFRSALKYNPDSVLDGLEVSSDLKSLLRERGLHPVRAALYGKASPKHVYVATAVLVSTNVVVV